MSDRIEDAAARWAVRHPLDAAERSALDAWLERDPRHAGALLRAMAGLSLVDRAMAPAPTPAARPATRRHLLAIMAGAMAASVAGVVGWRHFAGEHVSTARGEIRRLPLADGSVATINTSTALLVAFAKDTRRVSLERGQVWFQVAKDRTRPFVVDAGLAQIRAVGTAFAVERGDRGVEIAVTEGTVAVWPRDAGGEMTILTAGQFARFSPGAAAPATGTAPDAIDRALAWRSGEIALENETVDGAVTQFNRYNRLQLVVVDPSVGSERLVGLFRIDKPADFATTLAVSLDVVVVTTPTEIRLMQKKTTSL